ncbi:MAG: PBSX family phage terminase large subunit [Clostridia bacterium]|nr:PBSX family phage terminase large subunit [Clostridia bacterium]
MSNNALASFSEFSPKQLDVLTWWCRNSDKHRYDAIICDGAVRSGKTVCMSLSFVAWTFYDFNETSFAICGKTIASLKRNVITPLTPILTSLGFGLKMKSSQNFIEITYKDKLNRFYLFGGKDEGSASLIQGMTLGGVLLDEVALMPRSFVEQAIARCSLEGSKMWFNCNPEHPMHWFYREWIKKAKEKNCLYLHFTMHDNPALTPTIIRRYESLYSGAFYKRFVEGKWVAAQGTVYPMFSSEIHVRKPPAPSLIDRYYISCDYGTVNPCSFGLWGEYNGRWYRIREYYYNSRSEGEQRTDIEHYEELEKLAGTLTPEAVIVDPSAASFIQCIRRKGRFTVIPAKNDVLDGIRQVSDALKQELIYFSPECEDTLREFSLYKWDEKAVRDAPRKENDHAMDELRYFVTTALNAPDNDFFVMSVSR